jgi:hypothetical protein
VKRTEYRLLLSIGRGILESQSWLANIPIDERFHQFRFRAVKGYQQLLVTTGRANKIFALSLTAPE